MALQDTQTGSPSRASQFGGEVATPGVEVTTTWTPTLRAVFPIGMERSQGSASSQPDGRD